MKRETQDRGAWETMAAKDLPAVRELKKTNMRETSKVKTLTCETKKAVTEGNLATTERKTENNADAK